MLQFCLLVKMSGNGEKRKGSFKGKGAAKRSKGSAEDVLLDIFMNQEYTSDEFKQLFSKFWKGEVENLAGE